MNNPSDLNDYVKIFSCGNKTTYVNEETKSMIVVFAKNIDLLNDIDFTFGTIVTKNDKYTKFTSVSKKTNCDCLMINGYSQSDYNKHAHSNRIMLKETPEHYKNITLPNVVNMSKQWILNLLDGISEQDRIIYQNQNFILVKDIKWTTDDINEIHILALPKRRDILSIRDLDGSNINLIKEIDKVGREQLFKLYNLNDNQIRSYFHYHPSFWHLHIHFDTYNQLTPSVSVDFCRLVHDVIENITIDSDYYKKATLNIMDGHF